MRSLFHLAFHVTDLDEARRFYGGVLGCTEGRSTDTWVDFDFSVTSCRCTWAPPLPRPTPGWSVATGYRCRISVSS